MPRGYRVAAMAALAYSLVVVYASLYPFIGWQTIEVPFGMFLSASWPRWITIEDVGNVAAFLLSDLAAGVTAEITYVDGGFSQVALGGE